MALVPASSRGGVTGIASSGGPITLTGGLFGVPAEVVIQAPAGAKASADEILTVQDDTGAAVFGVDAVGGIGFHMVTAPFTGRVAFDNDGATFLAIGSNPTTTMGISPVGAYFNPILSGALPAVAPVSGTAFQCSTARDVLLVVPVTYNPGVATTATCKVELSPDGVTYTTLATIATPVGTVFDGSVDAVTLAVPKSWLVKLTVTNATLGTGHYY